MSKRTTIVNLFAGPGAGKSTFCAGLFASLKWIGIDCEMATEYAKDMVWQRSYDVLENQLYVFGKQQNRLFRLNRKVDIIVTDSPLINSIIYDAGKRPKTREAFVNLVLAEHNDFDNLNFFIERRKAYNPNGRLQTPEEATELDAKIRGVLDLHHIPYVGVPGVPSNIQTILWSILAYRPDLKPKPIPDDISRHVVPEVLQSLQA
jgi:hypothetical protein